MKIALAFTTVLLASAMSASANAQMQYVVIQGKLDQVMQPSSGTDAFQECIQSAPCKLIVDSAMTYFGLPSGTVTSALAQIPRADRRGEEGDWTFRLPAGYSYCKSQIETVSVVPFGGPRASLMRVTSESGGISVYAWTPRLPVGQGRSWIEANFTIVGVRDGDAENEYTRGSCKRPRELVNCRGNGTGGDGRPACGTFKDG